MGRELYVRRLGCESRRVDVATVCISRAFYQLRPKSSVSLNSSQSLMCMFPIIYTDEPPIQEGRDSSVDCVFELYD